MPHSVDTHGALPLSEQKQRSGLGVGSREGVGKGMGGEEGGETVVGT